MRLVGACVFHENLIGLPRMTQRLMGPISGWRFGHPGFKALYAWRAFALLACMAAHHHPGWCPGYQPQLGLSFNTALARSVVGATPAVPPRMILSIRSTGQARALEDQGNSRALLLHRHARLASCWMAQPVATDGDGSE